MRCGPMIFQISFNLYWRISQRVYAWAILALLARRLRQGQIFAGLPVHKLL